MSNVAFSHQTEKAYRDGYRQGARQIAESVENGSKDKIVLLIAEARQKRERSKNSVEQAFHRGLHHALQTGWNAVQARLDLMGEHFSPWLTSVQLWVMKSLNVATPPPDPDWIKSTSNMTVDTTSEFDDESEVCGNVDGWQPFPTKAMPEPLSSFVANAAAATGVDQSYIAAALLVTIGAAIGTTRQVQCKVEWNEFPVLWIGLVGKSGCGKSPGLAIATKPIKRLQHVAAAEHQQALDMMRGKGDSDQIELPKMPCLYAEDITIEGLIDRLVDNPRGLVVVRDELAGWVDSMNSYRGGKGGDESAWLSFFDGREAKHDRKSAKRSMLFVPHAAVSLIGGIQPGVLRECLTARRVASGMAARLMVIHPPEKVHLWTDAEVDQKKLEAVCELVDRIYRELNHGDNGKPQVVSLDAEAKRMFRQHYDNIRCREAESQDHEAAALSKSIAVTARLALILHCVRIANHDPALKCFDEIDKETMDRAITIGRWLIAETLRVTYALSESPQAKREREILELASRLKQEGKPTTIRELMRHQKKLWTKQEDAEAELIKIVASDKAHWSMLGPGDKGGRPTRQFKVGPKPPASRCLTEDENENGIWNPNDGTMN
jgi:hypothetical protein